MQHANHKQFVTTGATNLLVPGIAGYRIVVLEVQFYNTVLQDVWFQSNTKILEPAFPGLPATSGFTRQYNEDPGFFTDFGESLYLACSAPGPVHGYVKYQYVQNWDARIN